MSAVPLLAARELVAGYGGRRRRVVLDGVSVELSSTEMVAVLGPNGAGKSTLLRTLAGMLPALGGELEIEGESLASLSPRQRARRIGVVLPERVAPGMLRGADLVALGRYPRTGWSGRLGPEDLEVVERMMRAVGAAHLAGRDVGALSDGERQRLMIARALAQEPRMLILDEPTAYLDLPGRVDVMHLLARLAGEGSAVLISTHDLDLALRTAGRVWLLDHAGELRSGTPGELLRAGAFEQAFASEQLARYLPEPAAIEVARSTQMAIGLGDERIPDRNPIKT